MQHDIIHLGILINTSNDRMIKHRYDVYLEKGPEEDASLVLMRFPGVKPQFRNPADQIQMSIRPKSHEIKLSVTLDPNSPNFCRQQAGSLGQKSNPRIFDGFVNKNVYTSTKTKIEDGQLYVCKLDCDRLTCRPVSDLLTMRADLTHFNIREEPSEIKEEVRPVSVKFAAPERHIQSTRVRTDDTEDPQDEPKTLSYASLNSRDSSQIRHLLFETRIKADPDAEPEDCKPSLDSPPDVKPKIERMEVDDVYNVDASAPQTSPRKTVVVKQRVKDCLLRAKLVSFEEVYNYIKADAAVKFTNKDVLDALADMAVLVQGNWAVKSEVLYGDSSERDSTDVTGISIRLFIAARDYLLWLLDQNRVVSRPEFSSQVKIPDYDVLELMNQVGTFREDIKRWELKLPTDQRFIEKFPEVVQRQAKLWTVRRANKLSIFA